MTKQKWASQVVLVVKNSPANAGDIRNIGSLLGSGRSLVQGILILVFLLGKSHGQRSLVGHRVIKSQTQLKQLNTHTHKQSWFNT